MQVTLGTISATQSNIKVEVPVAHHHLAAEVAPAEIMQMLEVLAMHLVEVVEVVATAQVQMVHGAVGVAVREDIRKN